MIGSHDRATGFVSDPFPGGGTFTLTTYVGVFLGKAEQMAGPREPDWTILGVEFFGWEGDGATPMVWYPGNRNNVAIRLTRDVANDPRRAIYQLAHECAHLISPSGGHGRAPNLEEGFAVVLAERMAAEHAQFCSPLGPSHPYYRAYRAVQELLCVRADAIRLIRMEQPKFAMVTPDTIVRAVPGITEALASRLCERFGTDAG